MKRLLIMLLLGLLALGGCNLSAFSPTAPTPTPVVCACWDDVPFEASNQIEYGVQYIAKVRVRSVMDNFGYSIATGTTTAENYPVAVGIRGAGQFEAGKIYTLRMTFRATGNGFAVFDVYEIVGVENPTTNPTGVGSEA